MDQTLHTFISITSSRVIEDFTLTVTIGGTLYLTMVGYMMITGTIEQSALSLSQNLRKIPAHQAGWPCTPTPTCRG